MAREEGAQCWNLQEIRDLERRLAESERRNDRLEGQAQLAQLQVEKLERAQQAEVEDLNHQLRKAQRRAQQLESEANEARRNERRMEREAQVMVEAAEAAQRLAAEAAEAASEHIAAQHAQHMAQQQARQIAEVHAKLAVQQQVESMKALGNGSGPVAWAAPPFIEALKDAHGNDTPGTPGSRDQLPSIRTCHVGPLLTDFPDVHCRFVF
eukprot:s542_g9.t1